MSLARHFVVGISTVLLCLGIGCSEDDSSPNSGQSGNAGTAGSASGGSSGSGGTGATVTYKYPMDDVIRINQIQVKGTHNSYHIEQEGNDLEDWNYTHAPLDVQLNEQGVRFFELDTHYNWDNEHFDVYHLSIIDPESTCKTLTNCLKVLEEWSSEHPLHHLLFVMIEPKDAVPAKEPDAWMETFENDILAAWPKERILTPDDVQKDAATLPEALAKYGWPTLGETRGKIMFFVNNTEDFRDLYTHSNKDLKGRLMFVESNPQDPFGAVLIHNNPVDDAETIKQGVLDGFMVRTFADSVTEYSAEERDQALKGGANLLSSDFPVKVTGVDYVFEMPDGTPSRCNPLNAPKDCTSKAIEDPEHLR